MGAVVVRKLFNLALLVGILVGAVFAWRTSAERIRLERRYRLLSQTAGDLLVTDPSRPLFRAIHTGETLHYAWRIYLPANYSQSIHDRSGNGGSGVSSVAGESIGRVRFRENASGGLDVYSSFWGASRTSTFAQKPVVDLMRGRWGEIVVEQIGKEPTSIDPAKSTVMLRLTLPPALQDEMRRSLSSYEASKYVPVFYELILDPKSP